MTTLFFFKAALSFIVGAGLGIGIALLCLFMYFRLQPPPTGQIGDIGAFAVYFVGTLILIAILTLLEGIAGIVMMKRLMG